MKIPAAELELLAVLNQRGQATARDLREALEQTRPMAHGSVVTLLTRLEAKGLVTKRKADEGKAFVYSATAKGRQSHKPLLRNLLDRVFAGSSVQFVASLFESRPPSEDEIEELQTLLEELRKKKGKR